MTVAIVVFFLASASGALVLAWRIVGERSSGIRPPHNARGQEFGADHIAPESPALAALRAEAARDREAAARREAELWGEAQDLRERILELRGELVESRKVSAKRDADLQRIVSDADVRLRRLEVDTERSRSSRPAFRLPASAPIPARS